MIKLENTKYQVHFTSRFKKEFRKVLSPGKDEDKLLEVLKFLANGEDLEEKYRNHKLVNN